MARQRICCHAHARRRFEPCPPTSHAAHVPGGIRRCQFWCQLVLGFGAERCASLQNTSCIKPASTLAFFGVLRFGAEPCKVAEIAL